MYVSSSNKASLSILWIRIMTSSTSTSSSTTHEWECIQVSLSKKASPYQIKPWINYSLTLDGRDKLTKVIQYFAKFIAFYYESLQTHYQTWKKQDQGRGDSHTGDKAYYQSQVIRFRKLQKALSEARKAFGLGRFCIEYYKLKETGILQWLSEYMVYWKNQGLVTCQAYMMIPKALPFRLSFPFGALRNFTQAFSSIQGYDEKDKCPTPLSWKTIAQSSRLASMIAFYAFDNISFLSNAGFLDTVLFRLPFIPQRQNTSSSSVSIGPLASRMANRTYFFSSLLNLLLSWKEWKDHQRGDLKDTWDLYQFIQQKRNQDLIMRHASAESKDFSSDTSTNTENPSPISYNKNQELNQHVEQLKLKWDKVQSHHFTLMLNLLKNSCDVLVFANSTGVDLPMKISGRKMNEGIHSICGILSAICVIIQNFPCKLVEKDFIKEHFHFA